MKQVLFEEDGAFRVGTILSEAGATLMQRAWPSAAMACKANPTANRSTGAVRRARAANGSQVAAAR